VETFAKVGGFRGSTIFPAKTDRPGEPAFSDRPASVRRLLDRRSRDRRSQEHRSQVHNAAPRAPLALAENRDAGRRRARVLSTTAAATRGPSRGRHRDNPDISAGRPVRQGSLRGSDSRRSSRCQALAPGDDARWRRRERSRAQATPKEPPTGAWNVATSSAILPGRFALPPNNRAGHLRVSKRSAAAMSRLPNKPMMPPARLQTLWGTAPRRSGPAERAPIAVAGG
jgi:hypothetical protein